jgi:CTP synthase
MRLGSYDCEIAPGSLAHRVYGTALIRERHRHRYEFNCLYEKTLYDHGLRISGRSPDGKFVEIAELPGHPWYLAVQFHPEFVEADPSASALRRVRRRRVSAQGRAGAAAGARGFAERQMRQVG